VVAVRLTVRLMRVVALGGLGVAPAAACRPDLQQTVSIVSGPQILAVRSDPAQAPPRAAVRYTALVVDSTGPVSASAHWAFCNAREPLAELGPVSPKCYQASGDWFLPFGFGTQAMGVLPGVACRQFGPEVPQALPNQPPGRPVDPDATGGYYQPVRVLAPSPAGDVIAVAETRLTCGLAGTPDQVAQFAGHYVANVNPVVDSLSAGGMPFPADDSGATSRVHPGESLTLDLAWASCPQPTGGCGDHFCDLTETAASCPNDCATLGGCSGAETYVNLDLATHTLVTRREGMQVSWFATAGAFDNDRTGRDPSDLTNSTTNQWHAPEAPGMTRLWVVLRDDRGGVGWAEYAFDVR
jgi:hypothetical protein